MAGELGLLGLVVAKIAFMDQQIHATNFFHVVGVRRGNRVGDVGQRAIGPIDAVAHRPVWVFQREMRQHRSIGEQSSRLQDFGVKGRLDGKQELGKQMSAHSVEFFRLAVDGDPRSDVAALDRVAFVMRAGKVYKNEPAVSRPEN